MVTNRSNLNRQQLEFCWSKTPSVSLSVVRINTVQDRVYACHIDKTHPRDQRSKQFSEQHGMCCYGVATSCSLAIVEHFLSVISFD